MTQARLPHSHLASLSSSFVPHDHHLSLASSTAAADYPSSSSWALGSSSSLSAPTPSSSQQPRVTTAAPAAAAAPVAAATTDSSGSNPSPPSFLSDFGYRGGAYQQQASPTSASASTSNNWAIQPPFATSSSPPVAAADSQLRQSFSTPTNPTRNLPGDNTTSVTTSAAPAALSLSSIVDAAAASTQLSDPWTPKPRVWNEQSLFDELKSSSSSGGQDPSRPPSSPPLAWRMQTYVQQGQYMLPFSSTSSAAPASYAAPPAFGGGLGGGLAAAFPEYMPAPYGSGSYATQAQPATSLNADQAAYEPPESSSSRTDRGQVGPAEYAQALESYRHIRAALPHIRPADSPGAPATGQPYRSILDCASTALSMLAGRVSATSKTGVGSSRAQRPSGGGPDPKRQRLSNGGDKGDKPAPFCRGCGATETPEWRRGPLGPRTLCNACGLVHMKMMRKKKKAEEKAAAEAAASKSV